MKTMKTFKFSLVFVILILFSCKAEKENFEFTFFKWSIHGDYYLRVNSSDTLYLVIDNPIEKQNKFVILQKEQKDKIESFLSQSKFPKEEYFSRDVNDGLSYAFMYSDKRRKNKLLIHAHAGPTEFWEFGEYLENLKNGSKFINTNRKINLKDIQKMLFTLSPAPPPPKINTVGTEE